MADHFAAFDLPRRPWLDPDELKERFHRLTADRHPDVAGSEGAESFARLTKAYSVLRDPAARLRHLIELEYPDLEQSAAQIPEPLASRFMQVATLQREAHVFVQQQSSDGGELARALSVSARFGLQHDVEKLIAELESDRERALELLKVEDELWVARDAETHRRLARLQQELAFLAKWTDQLSERLLGLQT